MTAVLSTSAAGLSSSLTLSKAGPVQPATSSPCGGAPPGAGEEGRPLQGFGLLLLREEGGEEGGQHVARSATEAAAGRRRPAEEAGLRGAVQALP